jgi:hypothetical protein
MISVIDEHHLRVGDRVWWGHFHSSDYEGDQLEPYGWKTRQFIVRFESKWSVSVLWGYCSYSDNHDRPFGVHFDGEPPIEFTETPDRVELGIIHDDREGVQGGDVLGYCDEDDVNFTLDVISKAATTDTVLVKGHLVLTFAGQ